MKFTAFPNAVVTPKSIFSCSRKIENSLLSASFIALASLVLRERCTVFCAGPKIPKKVVSIKVTTPIATATSTMEKPLDDLVKIVCDFISCLFLVIRG